MTKATEYRVIGTRPIRHDGMDKVTGRAIYGADIQLAALLHGRILRSPHAHAKIRRIDTSAALALPGVEAVITSNDLIGTDPRLSSRMHDRRLVMLVYMQDASDYRLESED